ncbi:sulfite exporter TauE/SafE family protein [Actinoplanes sp. NEAU-A12]|uniref:Probable membrane transporter protein n=1 Tax=Actinoplanes sandaracinus TaxID=3045177 RepID=A0ABT6WQC6_9ACTN|nr:sulfite exporter TauE/SafE family protein [Actinoplanes sandaracinus]MDI6101840.1 sulfite exporter TauE/SafE family protein [Actinoplanes sandaracinus]
MDSQTILIAAGVLAVAALAQAATGFGFSLLAVPLLGLVVGPVDAVVGSSILAVLINAAAVTRDHAEVRWRTARTVLVAGLAGLPFGLLLLTLLPARTLTILIAVCVLGGAFAIWRGLRLRAGRAAIAAAGFLSGILTTATGVNGPPMAAAFSAMGLPPRQFRATLAAIFVVVGPAGLLGFALAGQFTARSLTVAAVGLPAVALGWWAGDRLFTQLTDPARFRTVVLCALVAASAITLFRAAFP